jgi:thymidine kinase
MFAGKSSTMLRDVERYSIAKKRCIIIKYAGDNRYDHLSNNGGIVCHDGIERSMVPVIVSDDLKDKHITSIIDDYDVIGISELQFFKNILIVDEWADKGKIIICEALNGDYRRKNFENFQDLFPLCEEIIKIPAVCMKCYSDASFTKKIANLQSDVIDIGGSEKYIPVCRGCYKK